MAVSQSITLTQGTQSVANNTTQVTFKWTSTQTGESWNGYTKTAYYYVSINGGAETKYSVSYTLPKNSTKTIAETTFTVSHKSDGTGSIKIRTWMDTGISAGVVEKSSSLTLTTIPRASSITSASNITLGNACNIKWTPASSSFKYKINFKLGNWSYTTDYISPNKTSEHTYSGYTISGTTTANSTTIYAQLPTATSGTMTATLTTYNSSNTQIGSSSSKTFTVTIPSDVKPTLGTLSVDPVNITTSDGTSRNILVQGKNKITVSVSGSGAGSGSTIKNYKFEVLLGTTVIASTITTSTSVSLGPFSKTGTLKFRLTVTDNRGKSISNSGSEPTATCYEYGAPSFSSFKAYRCRSDGTADDNGTYIKYDLQVDYKSVNSTNKSTVKIYYKTSSATSWTAAKNALTNATTKTAAAIVQNSSSTNITFNAASTYMVYATVTDNYGGSVKSSTVTVFGASRIFNIRPDGSGIAFGKMAETNNMFEVKWPAQFNDTVTVPDNGGPVFNGYSVGTLGPGIGIQGSDDLNTYTTPGVFYSTSASVSATLSNTPVKTSGFRMVVEYIGSSSYVKQTITTRSATCKIYKRYKDANDAWNAWQLDLTDGIITDYIDQHSDSKYLKLSGGTLTGKLTLDDNLYYATNSTAGLDCNNSDIINANGVYFKDASESAGEGINFYRGDGFWDTLYAKDGILKFHSNRATSTALGGSKVYTSANIRLGTCTLTTSSTTTVNFSSALNGTPTVMLTPSTSVAGALPGKVKSVSSTGFTAIIGGSATTSSVTFMYFAICSPS